MPFYFKWRFLVVIYDLLWALFGLWKEQFVLCYFNPYFEEIIDFLKFVFPIDPIEVYSLKEFGF